MEHPGPRIQLLAAKTQESQASALAALGMPGKGNVTYRRVGFAVLAFPPGTNAICADRSSLITLACVKKMYQKIIWKGTNPDVSSLALEAALSRLFVSAALHDWTLEHPGCFLCYCG